MWEQGDAYRLKHGPTPRPAHGIYSLKREKNGASPQTDTVLRILKKVDTMRIDDSTNDLIDKNYLDSEEPPLKPLVITPILFTILFSSTVAIGLEIQIYVSKSIGISKISRGI